MNEPILAALRTFTQEQAGCDPKDINEDTRLEEDLGIYGDDAVEYLIAFGKFFNVDVSKFMAANYFSGEGDFIYSFFRALFGMKSQRQKELSMAHLVKAIKSYHRIPYLK